jgi:pyruvate formate lyase activating enzyme
VDVPPAEARPSAAHWSKAAASFVECGLCFRGCAIAPGASGFCGARANEGGALVLPFYGAASSIAVDPIEKKPLHHFLPGSGALSVGFFGCNLRCPFCQNWEISQEMPPPGSRRIEPGDLIRAARRAGAPSIAYTYSEPTVHFEFTLEAMRLARAAGLRNVLVTNGSLREGPALELLELTDAANVDLKCWSAELYSKKLGGSLEATLAFIGAAARICHLEVTTLVVPGISDGEEDVRSISRFLAALPREVPLHLSAYHPAWRFGEPPTSPELLGRLAAAAREVLEYVYVGNALCGESNTLCPSCGRVAVRRKGYSIDARGLASSGGKAACAGCGALLPIIV